MSRLHQHLLAVLLAATATAVPLAAAPASLAAPVSGAARASCVTYHVSQGDDWLRVHRSPGSSAIVGQVARGHAFCVDTFTGQYPDTGWAHGYGYNGSTKVTGWVLTSHLY